MSFDPPTDDRTADVAAFFVAKTSTAVAAWESGAKRPTPRTVAMLALSLAVDPGFSSSSSTPTSTRPSNSTLR
jgi:hypothetical protein